MKDEIYDALKKKNGIKNQMAVAIEECSELQKELTKLMRNKGNPMKLAEEIADVAICADQMIRHFDLEKEVLMYKAYKMQRLSIALEKGRTYK